MSSTLHHGHFELTSGYHSDKYVQASALLENPHQLSDVAEYLNMSLPEADAVIAPAVGAIALGFEVARQANLPFMFTERGRIEMELRRGFTVDAGKKYIVVEDVITSGGTVKEVVDLVEQAGGEVVHICCFVLRGKPLASFLDSPIDYMDCVNIDSWHPNDCPLCAKNEPIDTPGSRDLI